MTGISETELLPHARGLQQGSTAETHRVNLEDEVANGVSETMNLHHPGGFDGPSAAIEVHHGPAESPDFDLNRDNDAQIDSAPYIKHFLDATTIASPAPDPSIAEVNPPDMAVPPTSSSHYDDDSIEAASTLVSDVRSTVANYGPWYLFETKPSLRNYLDPKYRAIPNVSIVLIVSLYTPQASSLLTQERFIVPRFPAQDDTAWIGLDQS